MVKINVAELDDSEYSDSESVLEPPPNVMMDEDPWAPAEEKPQNVLRAVRGGDPLFAPAEARRESLMRASLFDTGDSIMVDEGEEETPSASSSMSDVSEEANEDDEEAGEEEPDVPPSADALVLASEARGISWMRPAVMPEELATPPFALRPAKESSARFFAPGKENACARVGWTPSAIATLGAVDTRDPDAVAVTQLYPAQKELESFFMLELEHSVVTPGRPPAPNTSTSDIWTQAPEYVPHIDTRGDLRFSHFVDLAPSSVRALFELGHALFDEIPKAYGQSGTYPLETHMSVDELSESVTPAMSLGDVLAARRVDRVSSWLETQLENPNTVQDVTGGTVQNAAGGTVQDETVQDAEANPLAVVFELLTQHKVAEAAQVAISQKYMRLALLISQAGSLDESFLADIDEQLDRWHAASVTNHIDPHYRKILLLLSGRLSEDDPLPSAVSPSTIRVDTAADLPWLRAFGLFFWYSGTSSLRSILAKYQAAFSRGLVCLPTPDFDTAHFLSHDASARAKSPHYELVRFFVTHDNIERVLDPANYGTELQDAALPWHLFLLLSRSLRFVPLDAALADKLTLAFAAQLEAVQNISAAVFVLLHLSQAPARARAVLQLLHRAAPALAPPVVSFLTDALHIPAPWIHIAQALHASHAGLPDAAFTHLVLAGAHNEAHNLLVSSLAPRLAAEGKFAHIPLALRKLNRQYIQDWSKGGALLQSLFDGSL